MAYVSFPTEVASMAGGMLRHADFFVSWPDTGEIWLQTFFSPIVSMGIFCMHVSMHASYLATS